MMALPTLLSIYALQYAFVPVVEPPPIGKGSPLRLSFGISNDVRAPVPVTFYNVGAECVLIYAKLVPADEIRWGRALIEEPRRHIAPGETSRYRCLLDVLFPKTFEKYADLRVAFLVSYELRFWPWRLLREVRFYAERQEDGTGHWLEGPPLGAKIEPIPDLFSGRRPTYDPRTTPPPY